MITKLGRVMVPVSDQDQAINFYTTNLGFTVSADIPFGEGERWVALVPPQGEYQPGRMTGIALESPDPAAAHAELKDKGVDVDAEMMGGEGGVPLMFFFRDRDKNHLLLVQAQ